MPRSPAPLLPPVRTREEWLALPRDEATYRAAVEEVRRRHGLDGGALRKYPGGSTIVFAVGTRHVVKLFEPLFPAQAETERGVLEHVHGRLGVSTPELVAAGEMEGWRYVVMEQLPGVPLAEAWDRVPPAERLRICRALGGAAARLHALPGAERWPAPDGGWEAFVRAQTARCAARQREHGLAEAWAAQVPGFLASVALPAGPVALLHTEVMREHVMVRRGAAGWEVSGIFDFEPAMAGHPEYELASVGVFLARGEPSLLRAFLAGYGVPGGETTAALRRRILAWALLHRYSKLRWYLEVVPPRAAATLDALADEWFATG